MASSATKQNLDFTNVKEGGNFSKKHMPAGDYLAKITKVEDAKPKDDPKTPMWLFTIQLKSTPSATYPYYCKLQENQLWKVRNLLVAAGINVPKKKVGVDPTKLVGKTIAVSLDDAEYNGKDQSEVGSIFSPSDLDASVEAEEDDDVDDVDEDDEEEAPKKSKKSNPAPAEDEDEDDEEEEPAPKKKSKKAQVEETEDDDDDDEEDEEESAPKKLTKKERAAARRAKKKAEAEAADDDDDDDEEDEDEEPAPKKKKAKKPAADEDDDDEIDIEDLD